MRFTVAVISNKGGRKNNEDYYGYIQLDKFGCYVLADGLGGCAAGEVASRTLVNEVISNFKVSPGITESKINEYLQKAQSTLKAYQKQNRCFYGMKTTVVLLVTDYSSVRWAHVGDSRLYYFKRGKLKFQTKDHSVPQAIVDAGEISINDIRFHEDRNRLLRAMGTEKRPKFDVLKNEIIVNKDDAFLLCSDGFWEYVNETEMQKDLIDSNTPYEWLKNMEIRLLHKADKKNDNYSAIAIFVD